MAAFRHAADTVGRLHRQRVSLSVPRHDVRRSRRDPGVLRPRCNLPLSVRRQLRRRPRRHLQRGQLQPVRAERSEGVDGAGDAEAASDAPDVPRTASERLLRSRRVRQ